MAGNEADLLMAGGSDTVLEFINALPHRAWLTVPDVALAAGRDAQRILELIEAGDIECSNTQDKSPHGKCRRPSYRISRTVAIKWFKTTVR